MLPKISATKEAMSTMARLIRMKNIAGRARLIPQGQEAKRGLRDMLQRERMAKAKKLSEIHYKIYSKTV